MGASESVVGASAFGVRVSYKAIPHHPFTGFTFPSWKKLHFFFTTNTSNLSIDNSIFHSIIICKNIYWDIKIAYFDYSARSTC